MFSKIKSILFWSIISAAFIGPGTITTAASAGAGFGMQLLWALTFSVIACLILQEAAAHLTILSGKSLGAHIADQYSSFIKYSVAGAIVFGCAAYQAGNITGAVVGLKDILPLDSRIIILIISALAGGLLWFGNYRQIAKFLGIIVATMGFMFLLVALQTDEKPGTILKHFIVPAFPSGSTWLILGLIGTTIVPYNLFLGSGISHHHTMGSMRTGLIGAILIGGIISISVLITGAMISSDFTFEHLMAAIELKLGSWSVYLFSAGLFAAGFTSSLTAPLAAAITLQGIQTGAFKPGINEANGQYRFTWISVMLVGALFSFLGVKPIPLIIMAQVINGFILPFITIFLILSLSTEVRNRTGKSMGIVNRLLLIGVVFICILLGLESLIKVFSSDLTKHSLKLLNAIKLIIAGTASFYLMRKISVLPKSSSRSLKSK